MLHLLWVVLLSYLLGSFPTSIVAGKILRGIDIRQYGSGNAGATNVFRVLGWKAGVVVLLIDIAKGFVPTVYFYQLAVGRVGLAPIDLQLVAGFSAVAGHIWTVFAGFKGGKGVGTGAGMLLGIAPAAVGISLIVFIATVAMTRYVSLGSILSAIAFPCALFVLDHVTEMTVPAHLYAFGVFIALLILFTHRSNIARLLRGTENRIQFSTKSR